VRAGNAAPYFVEIDLGYTPERLVSGIARKYGHRSAGTDGAQRLIVVADAATLRDPSLHKAIRGALRPDIELELWDEERLLAAAGDRFGLKIDSLAEGALLELRNAVERAKGIYAFGETFHNDPLEASLLWHCPPWRLRRLRVEDRAATREMLQPGSYRGVVVVMADLCAYSSFVQDTSDESVSRRALTSYASKTRHQILADGGMLYQFLGDSVVGIFGIPGEAPGYVDRAVHCARRLVDIGASVAKEWQRDIDKVQSATGVHVSAALGDLQVLAFRPFSRAHVGVVGGAINLCARLNGIAACDEIAVTNTMYRALSPAAREGFEELPPVEAKNVGRLRAWRLRAR
jgi:class 3 adenylate cyclase